jgi:hypothetical protein
MDELLSLVKTAKKKVQAREQVETNTTNIVGLGMAKVDVAANTNSCDGEGHMQGGQTQEFNICHAPRPPDTDPMAVKEVHRILINEEDNEEGFSQEDKRDILRVNFFSMKRMHEVFFLL